MKQKPDIILKKYTLTCTVDDLTIHESHHNWQLGAYVTWWLLQGASPPSPLQVVRWRISPNY